MISWDIIGSRIREIRGDRTQEDFGKTLGVSKQYISAVERGKQRPSLELLYTLSTKLDVSLDYILLGKTAPRKTPNPTNRYPEANLSPSLLKLANILDALWDMAVEADDDTRIWLFVQLQRAVPEISDVDCR